MSLGHGRAEARERSRGAAQALLAEARVGAQEALARAARPRPRHPPARARRPRARGGDRRARRAARRSRSTLCVELPERPPPPVESAAYFVAAEALANAGKHAGAEHGRRSRVAPRARRARDRESPTTARGGADPAAPDCRGCAAASRRSTARSTSRARPAGRRRSGRSCRAGRDRRGPRAPARRAHAPAARQRLRGGGRRAPTRDALVHAVLRERPDIAIVDIRLPPTFRDEGLRAALELRRAAPETAVLIVSQYVEQAYAAELLADGRGGRRLPAQGPDHGRRRLRRGGPPRRRGRHRARPRGRRAARRAPPRPAGRSTTSRRASSRCSG